MEAGWWESLRGGDGGWVVVMEAGWWESLRGGDGSWVVGEPEGWEKRLVGVVMGVALLCTGCFVSWMMMGARVWT